jgi:ribonucleoside-triphosphate reductase
MAQIIDDYVNKTDWRVFENANTGYSFSGLKSYIASSCLAKDSLSKLPAKIREAHKIGKIHIHDLDGGIGIPYCYGADLQQLMLEGLKNPSGSNSMPAKHFDTLIDHIVNFVYISQSEFNGAQAISNFDTLAAPFVIGKDYTFIKQNIQRLIYNLSYPLRSAYQMPFCNISFDITVPHHMEKEPVVVGGRTHEDLTYGDMQPQMDMINKAFLELMLHGDSQGKPFTFPIPTYGITKKLLEKNDDVTKLLYMLSAKFGNPNFQNYIGSGNDPSDVRSFCCRLNCDIKKLKSHGLWNMGNKTGGLGAVSINLNQASINGSDHFIENIDDMYDLAIEELLIKNKYIHESFDKGLLPFTKCYLDNKNPFKSFFHIIGIAGMNEACLNMFDTTIEFNQDFTIDMLKHLRKRTDETSEELGILHSLEETPIEGASYRLAKLDRKLGLLVQGEENPYLTNSTHCPVNTIYDWAATVKIQEKFKNFYNGGSIVHGFIGDSISPDAAGSVIKHMSSDTTIPYYNITPTFSMCQNHGYSSGNVPVCLKCDRPNYVYSRVVGYIQPVQKWNPGKKSEFKDRKMYSLKPSEPIAYHLDKDGNVVVD